MQTGRIVAYRRLRMRTRRLRAQDSRIGLGALEMHRFAARSRDSLASSGACFARFRLQPSFASTEGRSYPMQLIQNRRTFMAGLSVAAGLGLFDIRPSHATGEPPPETTTVRL